jgi:hypothetical protein
MVVLQKGAPTTASECADIDLIAAESLSATKNRLQRIVYRRTTTSAKKML